MSISRPQYIFPGGRKYRAPGKTLSFFLLSSLFVHAIALFIYLDTRQAVALNHAGSPLQIRLIRVAQQGNSNDVPDETDVVHNKNTPSPTHEQVKDKVQDSPQIRKSQKNLVRRGKKPFVSKNPIAPKRTESPPQNNHPTQATALEHNSPAKPETDASAPHDEKQTDESTEKVLKKLLVSQLRQKLSRYFYYPLLAKRRGLQGVVVIAIKFESGGDITETSVHKSSGHAILDNAALKAVKKIDRLDMQSFAVPGFHNALTLPIIYQLKEG